MDQDIVMGEPSSPKGNGSGHGSQSNIHEERSKAASSSERENQDFANAEVNEDISETVPAEEHADSDHEAQTCSDDNHENDIGTSQAKRQRTNSQTPESDQNSFHAIENLLSVPLKYILRRTSSSPLSPSAAQNKTNNPHLLSRMEASLLLQITTISYELDALFQMSIEAIENSHTCKAISWEITQSPNVFLRPLHCLLHIHGKIIPQQVIQYVQNELEGILSDLPVIIQSLRQCAEQNWSVSNALMEMNISMTGTPVNLLGKEKGLLAEIEDEVCKRLEGLIDVCSSGNESGDDNIASFSGFDSESMETFCARLFAEEEVEGSRDREFVNDEKSQNKLQYRSESIRDAATALGLLASSGSGHDADNPSDGIDV